MTSHSTTRLPRLALGGAVLGLVLVGCSGVSGSPSATGRRRGVTHRRAACRAVANRGPRRQRGRAVRGDRRRRGRRRGPGGREPAEVTVVSAESVTFPDGGLGCPEPEMLYTQVLTPGYHVVVEAGGQRV